jgi:hypothetical protein
MILQELMYIGSGAENEFERWRLCVDISRLAVQQAQQFTFEGHKAQELVAGGGKATCRL